MSTVDGGEPRGPEVRPERVDVADGTIAVDITTIEDRHGRLMELRERMEHAAAAFRTVGLTGPADLVTSWSTDVDEMAGWLAHHIREIDLAGEVAGLADARGITFAEALALGSGLR